MELNGNSITRNPTSLVPPETMYHLGGDNGCGEVLCRCQHLQSSWSSSRGPLLSAVRGDLSIEDLRNYCMNELWYKYNTKSQSHILISKRHTYYSTFFLAFLFTSPKRFFTCNMALGIPLTADTAAVTSSHAFFTTLFFGGWFGVPNSRTWRALTWLNIDFTL